MKRDLESRIIGNIEKLVIYWESSRKLGAEQYLSKYAFIQRVDRRAWKPECSMWAQCGRIAFASAADFMGQ